MVWELDLSATLRDHLAGKAVHEVDNGGPAQKRLSGRAISSRLEYIARNSTRLLDIWLSPRNLPNHRNDVCHRDRRTA